MEVKLYHGRMKVELGDLFSSSVVGMWCVVVEALLAMPTGDSNEL